MTTPATLDATPGGAGRRHSVATQRPGRHRRPVLPWWAAAIALVLMVVGLALYLVTGQPAWAVLAGANLAGWALIAVGRHRVNRRAAAR